MSEQRYKIPTPCCIGSEMEQFCISIPHTYPCQPRPLDFCLDVLNPVRCGAFNKAGPSLWSKHIQMLLLFQRRDRREGQLKDGLMLKAC
jgi:hypothetical protein